LRLSLFAINFLTRKLTWLFDGTSKHVGRVNYID